MEEPSHSEVEGKPSGYAQIYADGLEKNAILLARITGLLVDEKLDYESYKQISRTYSERLQDNLEIIGPYMRMLEKIARSNEEELKQAMEKKELLEIRKSVGDMSEEEYRLKSAVVEWEIKDLTKKQTHQNNSLKIETLSHQIPSEKLTEIRELITKAERNLTNMEYNSEPYETVSRNIEILNKIAPKPEPNISQPY